MSLTATTAPAVPAVSLDETKRHLSIDSADTTFDDLLADYMDAATSMAEDFHGHAYIERDLRLDLDAWPAEVRLPSPPLKASSVVIKYDDPAGTEQTLATAAYVVDEASSPARLRPTDTWPDTATTPSPIRISFTAGYGTAASDVPKKYRAAVLLFVGDLFLNRENTVLNTNVGTVPTAAKNLLASDRVRPDEVTIA